MHRNCRIQGIFMNIASVFVPSFKDKNSLLIKRNNGENIYAVPFPCSYHGRSEKLFASLSTTALNFDLF